MARLYCSFLLRYWRVGSGEQRIEIEHIQSGARTHVRSLAAAIDWIKAHGDKVIEPPAQSDGPDDGPGYGSRTSIDDLS